MEGKTMKSGLLNWIRKFFSIAFFLFTRFLSFKKKPSFFLNIKKIAFLFLFESSLGIYAHIDLEQSIPAFVLESKKINIPGYPFAYNPSLIRWKESLLLSFRITHNPQSPFESEIGLVWLDEEFNVISQPFFLDTKGPLLIPSRAEDGRLLKVGEKLFLVYSNNTDLAVTKGGFRVHIAEIEIGENIFELKNKDCLAEFDGENKEVREKNWVPFDYNGNLMLAYSLNPHFILQPIIGTGSCISRALSQGIINWEWGQLRGGTPGLNLGGSEFLAFFHSSKPMLTAHSEGKIILHYFLGAYTFSNKPPFAITKISPEPIVEKGFYSGVPYTSYYWKKVQRVIFPGGYIYDKDSIWIAYGREDHEIWIVKLNREGLMQSLVPVDTIN
jgi:predicted GH43/DUF377 family glycosyl hydrolase